MSLFELLDILYLALDTGTCRYSEEAKNGTGLASPSFTLISVYSHTSLYLSHSIPMTMSHAGIHDQIALHSTELSDPAIVLSCQLLAIQSCYSIYLPSSGLLGVYQSAHKTLSGYSSTDINI